MKDKEDTWGPPNGIEETQRKWLLLQVLQEVDAKTRLNKINCMMGNVCETEW